MRFSLFERNPIEGNFVDKAIEVKLQRQRFVLLRHKM
jgi:hypothetical protein